jgi:hypothetical protein
MRTNALLAAAVALVATAGCSGDSGLGPDPSALRAPAVSAGQNLVVSGAGLYLQPTRIRIDVPVQDPADILEATFLWSGRAPAPGGDDTILIDGVTRTGTLVASRDMGGDEGWLFFYRLDGAGIVVPGAHDYIVSGFDPGGTRRGGITLAVVYRDPSSPWSRVRTVEPQEFVRADVPGHERGSVWTFPVRPAEEGRVAKLTVVAADCEASRPDRIWWGAGTGAAPAGDLVGAVPGRFDNLLRSAYGPWLDVVARPNLIVPAGAGHFAYQLESVPGDGDCIVHLFGAVAITGDEPPCEASIGDLVWHDGNGNGLQDPGEGGMPGVTVTLLDAVGAELETAVTDGSGRYAFTGLCAGDYGVAAAAPDGFDPSPCDAGDDALDSECSTALVTLAGDGEVVSGVDFGFVESVPPLAPGCFFGVGFWKHELDVSLGDHPGRQHFSDEELAMLLRVAAAATSTGMDGGDGEISFREADVALTSHGPRLPREKALCHYLATLLNFAANGADRSVMVDTDADRVRDLSFGEAIDAIESMLIGSGASPSDCETAKEMAESINSMGCGSFRVAVKLE